MQLDGGAVSQSRSKYQGTYCLTGSYCTEQKLVSGHSQGQKIYPDGSIYLPHGNPCMCS